ncbi:MAG TPA: C39 family peptidase [Candidatus Moranbacteria bacterium]|nr:C39 family peptidase [Candidatus Moranbacteria bacterium]HRY27773.1 C39 family peptidase [Candidatus Moranbacteria bacterium]HSA08148.1 C39 family peptidase [Candidatus Moranbacteria bacterium]
MKIKRKNNFKYGINLFLLGAMFCAGFWVFYVVRAESISDINESSLSEKDQDKLKELERKEELYTQMIEIKRKQKETLENQLSINKLTIEDLEEKIKANEKQIGDLNDQIIKLKKQIKEKEIMLDSQRKLLANIVQTYYETNKAGLLTAYLSGENIASFIVKKDRIAQTGDRISELVRSITEIKKDLESQSKELDSRKVDFVSRNEDLQSKNSVLEAKKKQNQKLLNETAGDESRYEQLLARVQNQKQELLDIDQFFAASGLSAASYPKPDEKYFASTSWYYTQWDKRWGNDNIGNTRTLMKSYGCAVTAVSMVFTKKGVSMTPGKLANEPIFSGDLINWYDAKDWEKNWPVPDSHGYRHGNISWAVVDSEIKKGNPVIVYIRKSNGGGGHYVVVHNKDSKGKYVVHDPYFGSNIFLDTSRALVGAMGSSSKTSVDQMIIYN